MGSSNARSGLVRTRASDGVSVTNRYVSFLHDVFWYSFEREMWQEASALLATLMKTGEGYQRYVVSREARFTKKKPKKKTVRNRS